MNKDGKEEKVRNRELAGGSVEVIGDQALCQCSNGSVQIPLKVTSQQKFYCNSASRLIATNGDKDGSSLNFGNCKARNNSPCMPLIQWKYFYDKILISDKLFPLTMRSEGTCLCGGIVSFVTSGQQVVVNPPRSAAEAKRIAHTNPLFKEEDMHRETGIRLQRDNAPVERRVSKASVTSVRVNGKVYISPREYGDRPLVFTTTLTSGASDSVAVKWDVTRNGEDIATGLGTPPPRDLFRKAGEYKVFAYVNERGSKQGGGYVTVDVSTPKFESLAWKYANGEIADRVGKRCTVHAHLQFKGMGGVAAKARFCFWGGSGKQDLTDFMPLAIGEDGCATMELALTEEQLENIRDEQQAWDMKVLVRVEIVPNQWIEGYKRSIDYPIEYTDKEEIVSTMLYHDKDCKEKVNGFVECGHTVYVRVITRGFEDGLLTLSVFCHGNVPNDNTAATGYVYKIMGEVDEDGVCILEINTDQSWLQGKHSEMFDMLVIGGYFREELNNTPPDKENYSTRNTCKMLQMGKDKGMLLLALPKQEIEDGQSKTMVQEVTNSGCGGKYCIRKGESSKLIEEINIRLAGFGGCLPSDKFTDLTETCVRQFQRDYMHVEETGIICGNFLNALDEFGKKYPININEAKCKCGRCKGFGNERYLSEYNNPRIQEKVRRYEYPGIHRSLFWAVKAVMFYLSNKEKEMNYSLQCIFSGYRCHYDNKIHRRSSTNHMGKALDLHFYRTTDKKKSWLYSTKDNETIRANIFRKYLNAKFDWQGKNVFNLESTSKGASSWVHFDVREYSLEYLDKRFFASTIKEVDGVSIVELAKANGKLGTCTCLSSMWQVNTPASPSVVRKKEYDLIDANDALNYIFKKYGREMACIIEKLYRLETTHFTTKQYKKCGAPGMEVHGNSPYYGWDKTFFQNNPEYKPIGVWAAYEGKGLSGVGGNKQVTDKKKQFVIMPSVKAGMEYLVYYIKKHNNNYARWYSLNEEHQKLYRQRVQSIKSRIVNKIK